MSIYKFTKPILPACITIGCVLIIWTFCMVARSQTDVATSLKAKLRSTAIPLIQFKTVETRNSPVINYDSPGVQDNKYGFEGGSVIKQGSLYHLFVSEMVGNPFWEKMRLAHWTSVDAVHWKRLSTLYETNGLSRGPRHALWAPMPIFDPLEKRWNLFYVAYGPPGNTEGRIWRAVSQRSGRIGLEGPYKDVGIVLQRDMNSQPWEGSQGTDSFYPYLVKGKWYAFYGSHSNGGQHWYVGLATAPKLGGPWKRVTVGNPVPIEPAFIENPIVTRVGNLYVAIYDSDVEGATQGYHTEAHSVGYSYSHDGLHWTRGKRIIVQPSGTGNWARDIRTPLGLVTEGHGFFTLLYTGGLRDRNFFAVGMVRLKALIASP